MTVKRTHIFQAFFLGLVVSAGGFFFAHLTRLTESTDRLFGGSGAVCLRLQADALLSGRLAWHQTPFGHVQDAAWGVGGCYSLWGIGVPILQIPFELLARAVGGFGFPDRLTFLFFYTLVFIVALKAMLSSSFPAPSKPAPWLRVVQAALVVMFVMLYPSFMDLVYSRFNVYEEVVAYGCLWALLLWGVLLRFQSGRRAGQYFLLMGLAGFSVFIRPTLCFYAFSTFVVVFLLAVQNRLRKRALVAGGVIFVSAVGIQLLLNQIRFGSPLEFGYALNLSSIPPNDMALRFGYPFAREPIFSAARELFAIIFFRPELNYWDFFREGIFAHQSLTFRFREFYFHTFDKVTLAQLLMSVGAAGAGYWARRREGGGLRMFNSPGWVSFLWGGANILLLFAFYLRTPGIASRYVMDFFPAIMAVIVSLYFFSLKLMPWMFQNRRGVIMTAVMFLLWGWWWNDELKSREFFNLQKTRGIVNVRGDQVKSAVQGWRKVAMARNFPALPEEYRCPDEKKEGGGIMSNAAGWNITTDCSVQYCTTLWFENSSCIELTVSGGQGSINNSGWEEIQVKSNFEPLRLVVNSDLGNGRTLTFCPQKELKQGYQAVSIAWMNPFDMGRRRPHLRLKKVRKTHRPKELH